MERVVDVAGTIYTLVPRSCAVDFGGTLELGTQLATGVARARQRQRFTT